MDVPAAPDANLLVVTEDTAAFSAELRSPDASAGSPVRLRVSFEDGKRLLKDPELAEHRYEGLEP
jgi:hypothetical protein